MWFSEILVGVEFVGGVVLGKLLLRRGGCVYFDGIWWVCSACVVLYLALLTAFSYGRLRGWLLVM